MPRQTQKTKRQNELFINEAQLRKINSQYEYMHLKYTEHQLITIWLCGKLPPTKQSKLKLNLNKKVIVGPIQKCQQIICHIDSLLSEIKVKKIQGKQLTFNRQLYMEKLFQCTIYDKQKIQSAIKDMMDNFQAISLQPVKRMIKQTSAIYLVMIDPLYEAKFVSYVDSISITPEPTRDEIKKACKINQDLRKQCKNRSQIKQEEAIDSSSQQDDSQSTSNEQNQIESDDSQKQQNILRTVKKQEQQYCDLLQKFPHKQVIRQWVYQKNKFDLSYFRDWVNKNRKLHLTDLCFTIDPKDSNQIIIHLYKGGPVQSKILALQIYQKYHRVFIIQKTIKSNIKAIQKQFCQKYNDQYAQCKIVRGFMRPKSNQYALRGLIVNGKINKSHINTQSFVCISIVGLQPITNQIFIELKQFQANLPDSDPINIINIPLGKLKAYSDDMRIRAFAEQQARRSIQDFQFIQLQGYEYANEQVKLQMKIEHIQVENYKKEIRPKLQKMFTGQQFIHNLYFQKQDLTSSIKQKFLIFQSQEEELFFFSHKNEANKIFKQITKEINQQKKHCEKQIKVPKNIVHKIKESVKELNAYMGQKSTVTAHFQMQKIILCGPKKYVEKAQEFYSQWIRNMGQSQRQHTLYFNTKQIKVIQAQQKALKKDIESKYKVAYQTTNNVRYGTVATLDTNQEIDLSAPIVIREYTSKYLDSLPSGTNIFFGNQDDFDSLINDKIVRQLREKIKKSNKNFITTHKHQGYILLFTEGFNRKDYVHQFVRYCHNKFSQCRKFAFIFPRRQVEREDMMMQIIKEFQKMLSTNKDQKYEIFLIKSKLSKIYLKPHKKTQFITEQRIKYYIKDGDKKFYYSETGNYKISQALKEGKNSNIHLYGKDINHTATSHYCHLNHRKIIHTLTQKQFPIKIESDKITFELNGQTFQFPQSQYQKAKRYMSSPNTMFHVSLGVYSIDLIKRIQTNVFSGYQRKIYEEKVQEAIPLQLNLNISNSHVGGQVKITYEKSQQKSIKDIKEIFQQKIDQCKNQLKIQLKDKIKQENLRKIQQYANDDEIYLKISNTEVIAIGYNELNLKKFQKVFPSLINPSIDINYPSTWSKQTQQIQVFQVLSNHQEFINVQNQMPSLQIVRLYRIQNKFIYRRYIEQKQHLKQLNQTDDIKQLMLYHGTCFVDPKVIYEDKEECFNVNYSSQTNFLGRGTYFAVKPEYSVDYSYNFGELYQNKQIKGMLYCSVLVGESQKIEKVNKQSKAMKDTKIKDPVKNIKYESSTTFTHGSDIYAVYRSKRAYPHYLIQFIYK